MKHFEILEWQKATPKQNPVEGSIPSCLESIMKKV